MKRLIAIALAAVMLLGLAACGSINKTEVSVLWSGDGVVKVPDSLINAMERAMYIESIAYSHYGANGDQAQQTKQAETALNAGCAALAVELVDPAAAQAIVDMAKAKNVPVVFFNCNVDAAVVSGYNKCVLINTNVDSLAKIQGTMIAEALYTEKKKEITLNYDRNEDGKISYIASGNVEAVVAVIDAALKEKNLPALEAVSGDSVEAVVGMFTEESAPAELIITDNDVDALKVLEALQAKGYNDNRLTTHCIPLYTVGADADASAFTNTEDMTEEDLAVFIYNALNLVDAGQLAGTAVEDYDSIAIAVATVLRNMLKGNELMKDVAKIEEGIVADGQMVSIPYTTYAG